MSPIGDLNRVVSAAVNAVPDGAALAKAGAVGAPPLPEPTATWTDATTAALAALAEFFQKTREGMREVKKAFDASRQAQMAKEVESMRKEAEEIRSGALMQAATLAVSAHWGAMSLTTGDAALAAKYKWAADGWGKAGDPVNSVYESRAKDRQADATAARANADRANSSAEDIQQLADTQTELASKAMDAIRGVLEARHATAMAVLSRRG